MKYLSTTEEFICGKCGQKLTHAEDFLTDNGNNVICNTCYLNTIFPKVKEDFRNIVDYSPFPSKSL